MCGSLTAIMTVFVIWLAPCRTRNHHSLVVFPRPLRYDVRRENARRHLAFSFGEHFCLGAHLARMTLRVEFEELLARCSAIELTGEPARVRSNFVGGLKHLPVRLTPR